MTGKRAYVFAARGGRYSGTAADTETAFVCQLLGFLGIVEVEFIYAEGLAMGEEFRAVALDDAGQAIERLAA